MARRAAIMALILLSIPMSLLSGEKKPSGKHLREETLRINALELEQIDITEVISEDSNSNKVNPPSNMTVVLDEETLKFDFNSDRINPRYNGILKNLIDYITAYDYDVVIEGHTDSKGSNEYNMKLGLRRAENTKRSLLELGMPADRIKGTASKGEEEPVASNETEAGRAQNRRIEFKLSKRSN